MDYKNNYTPISSIAYERIEDIISKYFEKDYKAESIFSYNSSINRTAYLNWRINDFYSEWYQFNIMGYAYLDASINLMILLKGNDYKQADSLIFPILFNAIHGIEIYLKGLITGFNLTLDKSNRSIPKGHDIKKLSRVIRNVSSEFSKKYLKQTMQEEFKRIVTIIEDITENIFAETQDITFPRYPSGLNDKGTTPHFYVERKENVTVDLDLLSEQIVVIYYIFDYMETVIMEIIDRNRERG